MAKEYIDREAFIADKRAQYCDNCDRRKGMKNGKMRFVYDIGDAPCRSCGVGDMMDDIEDYPAADVVEELQRVKVKPIRHYLRFCNSDGEVVRTVPDGWECPVCHSTGVENYCPNCGAKMEGGDGDV